MTAEQVTLWTGAATAVLALLGLLLRGITRIARRLDEWAEDWQGTPRRPGVPARPGVMERLALIERQLADIETELHPNGGTSLRDALDRVDQRTARIARNGDEEA